jgi:hypothetical protein
MTYEELLGWLSYFERRPPDWRDDERTFKLLQAQGVKAKATEVFSSLKAVHAPNPHSAEAVKTLGGSVMEKFMKSAIGGDKVDWS